LNYNNCPLYGLKSKKKLKYLLHLKNNDLLHQDYISKSVSPYIDISEKKRLIEPPTEELKSVQKRIKDMLNQIVVPEYVFSGIKGRSYADNALIHTSHQPRNIFKVDLTAFFPSISRDTVYHFFLDDLLCSPDVANILTNLTTIDLAKSNAQDINSIYTFLNSKGISCYNHLISGAPTSQILSYLVNHNMFDEMYYYADHNNITMTVYVDDITFSSENRISHNFKSRILGIIKKYNFLVSKHKTKNYTKLYPKLITGVVIDPTGKPKLKNSLQHSIITTLKQLKENPNDVDCQKRLTGLLCAARQIDKQSFQSILRFLNLTKTPHS